LKAWPTEQSRLKIETRAKSKVGELEQIVKYHEKMIKTYEWIMQEV
jgi:hypothetical protein